MDYKALIKSHKDFFRTHKTKDISFRIQQLKKLKSVLQSSEPMLYDAIYKDFGKSKFDTFVTELSILYGEIDYFAKNLKKLSKPTRVATNLVNLPGSSFITYDPLGTVLVIGAWNYPYQLSIGPVISSMAAGNTTILKPSEIASHTADAMAKVINENFDDNYLRVELGGIAETTALLDNPYDKIFFTGSPRVGKIIYQAAAKYMTPITLELGGKSPTIVMDSANLDVAAKRIVWGKCLNAGQTCIAPDYIMVHSKVKNELIDKMKAVLTKNNYAPDSPHFTRIINDRNFERLASMIDQEKVIYGGTTDASTRYIAPTLMDVGFDHPIMEEEIFGPLCPIIEVNDFDTAMNYVLDNEKPLSAYLFTENSNEKKRFTHELSFGGGCINDVVMHIANKNLPFGGVGNSGIGSYHGKYGFYDLSHHKAMIKRNTSLYEPDLKYPPYSDKKMNLIKKLV